MKKISFLGKELSVFTIALLSFAVLGTAALVPYLSGLVVGNVDVESPFNAYIAEGIQDSGYSFEGDSIDVATYGGDTVEATVKFEYLGERDNVTVTEVYRIENEGITCEDFESITFDSGNGPVVVPSEYCTAVDADSDGTNDYIEISDRDYNVYDSGESNIVNFWLEFKLNAYGEYDMTAQIVPYN